MTTSPQIHFSILTNLASLNTTPQKLCLSLCTISWSLPSAIREYHASVFLTSPLHSTLPRQQKINAMNGAHLASPIRGELGYAHWPQLGTQFIALLGTKFGAH